MKDGASGEQTDLDREFISTTTLHGISRVIDSSRTLVKLLWLTILLVCLGVCAWQITDRFQRYFKYEATTAVSVEYQGDLYFPAVTICNFNRYRLSAMTDADKANLKVLLEYSDYDYDPYDDEEKPTETPLPDNFNYTEVTRRTGFQMDGDTLVNCEWRGKNNSCGKQNFTHEFTSFGNCWTFNSGEVDYILYQIQPGSGNGLKMMINIQQSEYTEIVDGGNVEAGLKILVHDQATPPSSVDTEGLAIGPGVHAFVGVRKVQHNNLEEPWGKCDPQMNLTYYNNYSLPGCAMECRAKKIVEKCKCRLVRHPGHDKECSPQQVKNCATPVLAQLKTGEKEGCRCPLPCNYGEFRTRLSTATLPNNNVRSDLWSTYGRDDFNYTEEQSGKYIRENWILLDVYYESLNLEKYVQSEAISPSALISDIGGQLGLFIGASFITMAEILDYLGRKSFRFIMSCSQRQAVEPTKTRPKEEAMGVQDLPSSYQ